jgi:KDO2-lipid IV(A) lauroyltransferase
MRRGQKPASLLKRLQYAVETVFAYLVYGAFKIMPVDTASAAGGKILRFLGPGIGVTRTARNNLQKAFPEKTLEEIEDIIGDMWENLGRTIAEYPHLHGIWRNVELVGAEHLQAARERRGPAIFFGGHLANWEIQPMGVKKSGIDVHLVYRKPNNPGVDGLLRHARDVGATGHIAKGEMGAREILRIIKSDGALGILVDQKFNEGIAVPFFGRDAMTAPAIAYFALKFDCALYPSRVERMGGAKFRLTFFPALSIEDTGDKEKDVLKIMTDINVLLESWIRERPAQWLWIHNRWPKE